MDMQMYKSESAKSPLDRFVTVAYHARTDKEITLSSIRSSEAEDMPVENGTAQKLVQSGISLIARGGFRALTVRDVAAMASISFPSVQYHFPAKADLLAAVFTATATRHCQTLDSLLANIEPGAVGPDALPALANAVLADWCAIHGELTVAAHEMLLAAYRDPALAGAGEAWIARQHTAWADLIARTTGAPDPDMAWFVLELLIGLSLTTLGCGRPIEAGIANQEILRFALSGQGGWDATPTWYLAFLSEIDRQDRRDDPELSRATLRSAHPAAEKILRAGVTIVAEEGSSMLTFRGVATRAGVAVTSVTNNFHTRENLVYRVYRRIQDDMAEVTFRHGWDGPVEQPPPDLFDTLLRTVMGDREPSFLAAYDLILAAARDERLSGHAWRMRMTRGIYLLVKRGVIPPPGPQSQFCSHIISLWGIGVGLLHHIRGATFDERRSLMETRLRAGFQRLPISRWPN
jgi:AcrR family transcriptional regulator